MPDTKQPVNLERAEGKISFEHVSFGYDSSKLLMKDISFTVRPGQKIAVVGSTGAGKTTLINLLMRFYEVNGGRILVDGVSSVDMTRKGLRRNFGMVLQDTCCSGEPSPKILLMESRMLPEKRLLRLQSSQGGFTLFGPCLRGMIRCSIMRAPICPWGRDSF